jgi:hypothetical protein
MASTGLQAELAAAAVAVAELREFSLRLPATQLSPRMHPTPGVFKTGEDARAVQIDIDDPTKIVQIGASLDPKEDSELIDFLQRNQNSNAPDKDELNSVPPHMV